MSQQSANFDAAFTNYVDSPRLRELFGQVFDPDLPPEVEAFSFVPLTGLRAIASEVGVRPDGLLLDLACGRGGPGLWVARALSARLLGIDFSPIAVAQALSRADTFGMEQRASFAVGTLEATGLADSSVDGAICVDAFFFASDAAAAAAELHRVLRTGARAVITAFASVGERSTADLLAAAGLRIVAETEHPDWEERRRAVYEAALRLEPDGDAGLASLRREAERALPELVHRSRVLVVAEKLPTG